MTEGARFAHASEAELARILDYYGVHWEYEPRTFPILWNLEGSVVESFSPDFYLPEMDVYVELTTLKQSLVRRKNRKLRRLRELYPDIRIKLFYGKDFKALMLKYGRFDLAASLSGLEGQTLAARTGPATTIMAGPASAAARPDELPVAVIADRLAAASIETNAAQPMTKLEAREAHEARLRRRPSRGSRRRRGRRTHGPGAGEIADGQSSDA